MAHPYPNPGRAPGKAGQRILALLLLAPILPACSYGSSGNHTYGMAPAGPMGLLMDTFSGSFPGTNWTMPTKDGAGNGTAAIDGGAGNPAPSLAFSTAARPGSIATTTQAHFTALNVTISVQVDASSAAADTVTVQIFDQAPALLASATYDASTGTLTLKIGGNSMGVMATTGMFHTLTFHVDGSYTASWSVDGGGAAVSMAAFYATGSMLTLGLRSDFLSGGAAIPTFHLDNVSVTTP